MGQEVTFGWVFQEGFSEEEHLSNPGRWKERKLSGTENNPNSEAGKWRTGLEEGGEVRYRRKEGREKRFRVSVWRKDPDVLV